MKKLKYVLTAIMSLSMILSSCNNNSTQTNTTAAENTTATTQTQSQGDTTATTSGEVKDDKYGGTLVVAFPSEPDTMNPYSTHLSGEPSTTIIEGLVVPDGNMIYKPRLAKEVPSLDNGLIKVLDDGKMDITYNLKQNVTWHDGKPFTSADVKFTWEALKNEAFLAESKQGVDEIESIDTPDDYTVVVHYKYQYPDFAEQLFTFGIMPKHVLEGKDLNAQEGWNREPIGTGPFMFKKWVPGEYLEVVKNPNYHEEGLPYLDGIVFKMITDQNTSIAQLKTGEVNYVMNLPYTRKDEVSSIKGAKLITNPLNSWRYLDFNTTKPGLNDVAVRRAFAYAIDKKGIVDQLFGGIPVAWDSPWMPMDPYYTEPKTKYEYSLDKAKSVLEEAGWKAGSDGIREKDGVKLSFEFNVIAGRQIDEAVQQVVIATMKQVGISITASNGAAATMTDKWFNGDFDIKMAGWITSPSPSRSTFYSSKNIPPNGVNHTRYSNPEMDTLLDELDKTVDPAKRKELVAQAQEIFMTDIPELVLFNSVGMTLVDERLEGFEPSPTNITNFWNTAVWYLRK